MQPATEVIAKIAAAIINNPGCLRATEDVNRELHIQLQTRRSEQPRLIGQKGATIYALKAIAEAMGLPDAPVALTLREPDDSITNQNEVRAETPEAILHHTFNEIASLKNAEVEVLTPSSAGGTPRLLFKIAPEHEVKQKLAHALGLVFHAIGKMKSMHIDLEWEE
jgi:predicted RNA-binding protein YlqC (UPF0109 family)